MNKRILWIEDEAKIHFAQYKIPLVRAGYAVDIASDATEAIECLRKKKYDALVFDLIFPCGDEFETKEIYVGLELIKRLVKQEIQGVERCDPARIMVFTVISTPEVHEKIKALGVKTILLKRLNELDDLKNHIDNLLAEGVKGEP